MSQYSIKVTLANDDVAEFALANATITLTDIPAHYTDYEYGVITVLLHEYLPLVATANIKKIEIEKEA